MWVYKMVQDKRSGENKRKIVWEEINISSMDNENPKVKVVGKIPGKASVNPKKAKKAKK